MLIKEYKEALPYILKARVNSLMWGVHAAGKTTVPTQVAKEHGWGFFNCRIGNMADAGDLLGLGDFVTDKDGNKVATRFFMPDWLKEANEFCDKNPDKYYVVHWDEVNRARKDLRVPLFQILLDNRLHTHYMHPNVRHIASANPNTDDYDVVDMSDKAFNSRWCHLKLSPHWSEWVSHQEDRGCDPTITDFIREQPKFLQKEGAEFNLDFVEPDRRNWEKVDDLLKAETPKNLMQELGGGLVGFTAMVAYIESLSNRDKPFKADEILNSYDKIKAKVKRYADDNGTSRTDLLKYTCDNIIKNIEQRQKDSNRLNKKEEANLSEFLLDIPLGVAFAACKELWMFEIFRKSFEQNEEIKNRIKKARNMA